MHEIRMPQMGQSVEEASIVEWLKQEGDAVAQDEPLFTIQTDKAEIECESTASGILRKILVAPDVEVPVLTVVALVGEAGEAMPDLDKYGVDGAAAPAAQAEAAPAAGPVAAPAAEAPVLVAAAAAPGGRVFASPRARAKAEAMGVDPATIAGSGPDGRVLEADVVMPSEVRATPVARRVAQNQGVDLASVEGSGVRGKVMKADVLAAAQAPVEAAGRVPLTPMRRIVAERMAESKYSAPHYYMTIEVDMTAAKGLRAKGGGFKPSFNDIVLAAVVKTLRVFPAVNARWLGDAIEEVADVNLGVAVALPEGLIVPVIKQAQRLSLEGISAQCKTLIEKAKTGKLLPDDYQGNTFTVSNLGPFGVEHFTAIINQPDSAILAVGQMKDRPVVLNGGIHIRPIMKMTLSSDHRVIDGAVAAQFMAMLKETLEEANL
ncbi:MAG: 2-oxo acid dehydrogenase subunit E2 [Nitrospiraceae bacterium]|nr:2-oxo acid dehydrogenase subunit E2 [Nitrospiraceae bacterium]